MPARSIAFFAVVASIGSLGFAGCGKTSRSASSAPAPAPTTNVPEAKFLATAGLASGAFDQFIYRPFKSGGSGGPLSHKLAVTQAAPAALLVYHELMLAASKVKSSRRFQGLFTPLTAAANTMLRLRSKFLLGTSTPADLTAAKASLARVKAASAAAGASIEDKVLPGEQPTGVVTKAP